MKNIERLLEKLGLQHYEPKVYLASLQVGTAPASVIGKKCGVNRSSTRYTCQQLVKKQLMQTTQKGNTLLFTAENPEKIQKLLELQKAEVTRRQYELDDVMQDLKRLHNPYTVLPKVTYHEGLESVINMLLDRHAKIENDTFEFSAHIPLLKKYPKEIENYSKKHMKYRKNNMNFVLDCQCNKVENDKEGVLYPNLLFKYYKNKNLDIKTHIQIDGDRIAIVSGHSESPVAIDIQHAEIAEDLKNIFRELWSLLPENA